MEKLEHRELNRELLAKYLAYDPETGDLTWKPRERVIVDGEEYYDLVSITAWNHQFAGKPAGTITRDGSRRLKIYGKMRMAHMIAWIMIHDRFPQGLIAHRDGNRSNIAARNLVAVSSTKAPIRTDQKPVTPHHR